MRVSSAAIKKFVNFWHNAKCPSHALQTLVYTVVATWNWIPDLVPDSRCPYQ